MYCSAVSIDMEVGYWQHPAEASISSTYEKEHRRSIHIYTDGSKADEGVGSGIAIFESGQYIKSIQRRLNKKNYVCTFACMHVCMHASMYVCMYACMHACMYVYMYMFVCVYSCDFVLCLCMYVCVYLSVGIWMCVCVCVCEFMYVCKVSVTVFRFSQFLTVF